MSSPNVFIGDPDFGFPPKACGNDISSIMYDYEDEIRSRISSNIFKIAFPVLLPLYFFCNLIDRVVAPDLASDFLLIRLSILPLIVISYFVLKLTKGSWYAITVWFFAVVISVESTYMAYRSGDFLSSVYIYGINLITGLFLFFFSMKFVYNLITLAAFYVPVTIVFVWIGYSSTSLASPIVFVSLGMFIIYIVVAKTMDVFHYVSFQNKTNLFFLATTDVLSGLKLRRYFFNRFIQELSLRFRKDKDFNLSIGIIDVDEFKKINDEYGHKVGDELIKYIGDTIKNNIRVYDTPCRFGGEEFIILFPDTKISEANIVCDRIRDTIYRTPFHADGHQISFTISIGVSGVEAKVPTEFETIQRGKNYKYLLIQQMLEMIKQADDSLYQAKEQGKNQVVTAPSRLITEINEEAMESLKGYLIYFDQDVFSMFKDSSVPYPSATEEFNFYSEEYFFRRAVESMYRSHRDSSWREVIAFVHIKNADQRFVRRELSPIFRLSDSMCMFQPGYYGFIFFGLFPSDLDKVFKRIMGHLSSGTEDQEIEIRIAAASLTYITHKTYFKKNKILTYRDFTQRITELFGILKHHRFNRGEKVFYYETDGEKKLVA